MAEEDEQDCRRAEKIKIDPSTGSAEIIVGAFDRQWGLGVDRSTIGRLKILSAQYRETTLRLPHIDPSAPRKSPNHDFEAHIFLRDVRVVAVLLGTASSQPGNAGMSNEDKLNWREAVDRLD